MSDKKKPNWIKRHPKWSAVIGIFVLLIIIGAVSGGGNTNKSTTASTSNGNSAKPASKATTATIGQPAADGKFQFTVNKISCGETSLSDGFGNVEATAQGQYCRLNITAKNIGTQSQSLDETAQYVYDAQGKKYSTDTTADIWAQPSDQDPWSNDINPGNSLTADIMYDVPVGVTPVTAELHDSALSGGVKVNLQ
ncbi:MAG TPA: DUF4352 domain-containing protein [Candidatus Babeliaceae bacterium]|nr:DUF4352 domain-containing protein [Candidatus Babeliaceae bacterium]